MGVLSAVKEEPIQNAVTEDPFIVSKEGRHYHVDPHHEYDLRGLVVSYRKHNADYGMHERAGDHLNVADLCVLWGASSMLDLNDFDFRNGEFTCFVKTSSNKAWSLFDMEEMSNNHLITEDDALRDAILDADIGDQIHLTGWLADYAKSLDQKTPTGFVRKSSINRTDTGNGACETIYVQSFAIIKPYRSIWYALMLLSGVTFLATLVYYFRSESLYVEDPNRTKSIHPHSLY